MIKQTVLISPSNQTANAYTYGNTNEFAQMTKISQLLKEELNFNNINVILENTAHTLVQRIFIANTKNVDCYISLHSNAGGGNYTCGFYNPHISGSYELCVEVLNEINLVTKSKLKAIDGTTWQGVGLKEINSPKMPMCLIEIAFHDTKKGAQFIVNNNKEIASAICKGICGYFGVEYKTKQEVIEPNALKVGDVVEFLGGYHYKDSYITLPSGGKRKPGKAKINAISLNGKHKYSLIHVDGESNVYGWVDAKTVKGG